jgi:hypothetical protein
MTLLVALYYATNIQIFYNGKQVKSHKYGKSILLILLNPFSSKKFVLNNTHPKLIILKVPPLSIIFFKKSRRSCKFNISPHKKSKYQQLQNAVQYTFYLDSHVSPPEYLIIHTRRAFKSNQDF